MQKNVKIFIAVIVVLVAGFLLLRNAGGPENGQPSTQQQGGGHAGAPAGTIAVDSRSFSFSPSTLRVKVGEKTTLHVQSDGTHTFTVDELGVNERTPRGLTTVEFTPTQKGTFQFYCATPGHREAGQLGTLTVE